MVKLDFHWEENKDWYHWDEDKNRFVVNDDAPEEAKKSYDHYIEQIKSGHTS